MKKKISILGSTGSIGLNSIKIINKKKNLFKINILVANKNYKKICNQIDVYKPNIFIINDEKVFNKVKKKYKNKRVKIYRNLDSKIKNFNSSDITIAAIPGIAGLIPTLKMIKKSKKILLANKESIICGWNLIKNVSLQNKTKVIPIDSEHFSIMKLLENENKKEISKIYLTASGGPFLKHTISKLKKVKPSEAIKHPKWKMGKKISIDSATLMNKMFEVIEAHKLFSIPQEKIEVVVHPESLVHAIIQFKNGLHKLIYHDTSMIIPLANAIFDGKLDIKEIIGDNDKKDIVFNKLVFLKVEKERFPIINLKNRLIEHISTPIIINAANEILVDQYLKKKIPFMSIYKLILSVLRDRNYKKYAIKEPKNINQILLIDKWSRDTTYKLLKNVQII